jgi:hypothetical protein
VIGRRFDPDLVAVVGGASESAGASFAAMEALDLIRRAEGSTEYEFKHVLVRDALCGTLLSGTIATLHLKVAEELERRCGNRLMEFAERLAHHYAATARTGALMAIQRGPQGVAYAMLGRLSEGIRVIKQQIAESETIGDHTRAAWGRIILAKIYIRILSGKEKPDTGVILKNIWTIIGVFLFGASRARALLRQAAAVRTFSESGSFIAGCNFDLGVLSAMKRKRNEARSYFERARVGAESQGADKLLQKIDAALAELQRGH